jgi:hypothetical protein
LNRDETPSRSSLKPILAFNSLGQERPHLPVLCPNAYYAERHDSCCETVTHHRARFDFNPRPIYNDS